MPLLDDIQRVWRRFQRYTGDGLPNPPVGHPLSSGGDPRSGIYNPDKTEIRDLLVSIAQSLGDPSALASILTQLDGKAGLANAGRSFRSRADAVSFGQANLPATLGMITVFEDDALVIRTPGPSSVGNNLFETYPNWGLLQSVRGKDITYTLNADRPTGQSVPAGVIFVVTRNGVRWRVDNNQLGPEDESHAFTAEGVRYFKMQQSGADERASPAMPGLRRSTDASYALHEFVDMAGGLHLTGLDGSVQENFRRTRQRLDAMKGGGVAVFDAAEEFGIDRTGSTDVSGAINAALRKLAALRSSVALILPAGYYLLSKPIVPVNGVSIIGAHRDKVRFLPNAHHPAFSYFYSQNDGKYLEDVCFGNFTIEGENQTLAPGGNYSVGTKGMYFHGFKNCLFSDLRILNTGATGLGIDFPDGSIIQRVEADNCGRNGHLATNNIAGASGIGIGTGRLETEMLLIADCIGNNNYNYGIFVEMQGSAHASYLSKGYIITGSIMRGNRWGFGEDGGDGTVLANNMISDNREAGVKLSTGTFVTQARPGTRLTMTGNEIARNGGPGVIYEGAAKTGLAGYQSHGNRIHDNAGAGHDISGSTAQVIDGWQIDDVITNNGGSGIHVRAAGQGLSNFDVRGTVLENTGAAIRLDGAINGGRIFGVSMRDLRSSVTQIDSIVGSGLLTNFDISEVQGVGCGPMSLTNPGNSVTIGRNVGI